MTLHATAPVAWQLRHGGDPAGGHLRAHLRPSRRLGGRVVLRLHARTCGTLHRTPDADLYRLPSEALTALWAGAHLLANPPGDALPVLFCRSCLIEPMPPR